MYFKATVCIIHVLFGDNITHYKTESVNFLGLMNSATKDQPLDLNLKLRGVGDDISITPASTY